LLFHPKASHEYGVIGLGSDRLKDSRILVTPLVFCTLPITPNRMPGVVTRRVPVTIKSNQHGEQANGMERLLTRGKWRPVIWRPLSAQMEAAAQQRGHFRHRIVAARARRFGIPQRGQQISTGSNPKAHPLADLSFRGLARDLGREHQPTVFWPCIRPRFKGARLGGGGYLCVIIQEIDLYFLGLCQYPIGNGALNG
jgi:hypothetical protein